MSRGLPIPYKHVGGARSIDADGVGANRWVCAARDTRQTRTSRNQTHCM